jgi:hypothetical protein
MKRVAETQGGHLGGDERLTAACYFQGRGSTAGQLTFGMTQGLGKLAESKILEHKAGEARHAAMAGSKDGYNTFDGSIAARFPGDKGVVAVTDKRIIVFGYKQGVFKTKIEDPVAEIDLGQLAGWAYRRGKLASVLDMAFTDESSVGIELPRANKPDEFAAALNIPTMD